MEEKVFPPKHPYLPKGCEGCQYDNLAYRKDNTNCQACRKIDEVYNQVERVDVRKAMENLKGISKSQHKEQLIAISQMKIYNPVSGEKAVFSAISEKNPDYKPLVEVARKLVKKEGCAYLLPNPKTLRTGDILFVNGSTYRLYEVKTIHGKNSVDNRLLSSIGQADMVILNITTKQKKVGLLGSIIQGYFENNENVREMRVFDGAKPLPPYKRDQVVGNDQFVARFRRDYNR